MDVPDVGPAREPATSGVIYARKFNRPSGLDPDTRVALRIGDWQGSLDEVTLNGHPLPLGSPPLEIDVTGSLESHNRVEIRLSVSDDTTPRLTGEITLGIDRTDA